ncbi:GNAT family N-acetyltransferase [Brucepastera parasyntrophica]|nr:GNAT family N-acetyltransferase [Brucepastera parasyntrophica]
MPCKYTYIQDFIITRKYRNKGYGTKLFEKSKQWAKEHNTKYIRLSVIPENNTGKIFYEKNGMEEQMITMECPVD